MDKTGNRVPWSVSCVRSCGRDVCFRCRCVLDLCLAAAALALRCTAGAPLVSRLCFFTVPHVLFILMRFFILMCFFLAFFFIFHVHVFQFFSSRAFGFGLQPTSTSQKEGESAGRCREHPKYGLT